MPTDLYLYIPTIPGSSTASFDDIHGNAVRSPIAITEFTDGFSTTITAGRAGKPVVTTFDVTKSVDSATVPLLTALFRGTTIAAASIIVMEASNGFVFLQYDLSGVLVAQDDIEASASGDTVEESVNLEFTTVEVTYRAQNANGSAGAVQTVTYDQATNTTS